MKRRDMITGLVAIAATSVVPGIRNSVSPRDGFGSVHQDIFDPDPVGFIDPARDRERSVILRPATAMDNHDTLVIPTPETSAPATATSSVAATTVSTATVSTGTTTTTTVAGTAVASAASGNDESVEVVKPAVNKNIDFARDYDDDIFVGESDLSLLHSVSLRLKKLQQTIGFGHFNLVSFDQCLRYAKRYSQIGEFTAAEKKFIERIFSANAGDYGFYGKKVTDRLTLEFKKSEAIKIPHSGHYLFKNESLGHYKKLTSDVGGEIILTSGIRSNVKQLHLFLAKTVRVNGNLSRASRSLAPPGYSYHGIGDFDVGKVGWGAKNFTDDFASTDEYRRMQDLGYIAIRYDHGNDLGVRFEPWHIKVV